MKHLKKEFFGASKMLFSRRGISPLIATVLIIGFTIALALIVVTWGGGFIKSTTKETGETALREIDTLTDVNVEFNKVSVVGGLLGLNIANNGARDVEGFIIKVHGETIGTGRLDEKISSYGGGSFIVGIENMPKSVSKVELLPIIDQDGENVVSKSGFISKNVKTSGVFKAEDLLLYMNFDSGVKDLSGNVDEESMTIGVECDAEGISGKACEFTGAAGSSIRIPFADRTDSFTVSVWTKTDTPMGLGTEDDWRSLLNQYDYDFAGSKGWMLDYQSFGKTRMYVFGPDNEAKKPYSEVSVGEWHNIIGVFDKGKGIRCYVDGEEQPIFESTADINPANFGVLGVGERVDHAGYSNFNGLIDEVIVINRALSTEEASGLYTHFI